MSINAKELRIGNVILLGGNTIDTYQTYKPHIVDAYTILEIFEENEERGDDYILSVFQPMKLTPEILEKCGFEKFLIDEHSPDDGYYYSMKIIDDKHCDLSFISGDKNGILEVCLFPYETWFIFQYLHQLQNLYYALTGKELDISKFIEQQKNILEN